MWHFDLAPELELSFEHSEECYQSNILAGGHSTGQSVEFGEHQLPAGRYEEEKYPSE